MAFDDGISKAGSQDFRRIPRVVTRTGAFKSISVSKGWRIFTRTCFLKQVL